MSPTRIYKAFLIILNLSGFFLFTDAYCQSAKDSVSVGYVIISGNDRTREHIILRELEFEEGDKIALADTAEIVRKSREKIFNTGLFVTVELKKELVDEDELLIYIELKERWYIFPIPILDLADRNINEWWSDRDRGLDRFSAGINFKYKNFRGRNEEVRFKAQAGFTEKFELFYDIPYINKKLNTGLQLGASYAQAKQVAYNTLENKLFYVKGDKILQERFYAKIGLTRRQKFYSSHFLTLFFREHSVRDTVNELNPIYFGDEGNVQTFLELVYRIEHDRRDIQAYPLNGYYLSFETRKLGLGIFQDIDITQLFGKASYFTPLSQTLSFAGNVTGKISFKEKQPYYQFQALGYEENFVRGYELYVVDGQQYALNRNELRFNAFSTSFENSLMPIKQFATVPLAGYFKIFTDNGYVWSATPNEGNKALSNEYLWGGGLGFDLVTYYDLVFRIEYAFTNLRGSGLFFHLESGI